MVSLTSRSLCLYIRFDYNTVPCTRALKMAVMQRDTDTSGYAYAYTHNLSLSRARARSLSRLLSLSLSPVRALSLSPARAHTGSLGDVTSTRASRAGSARCSALTLVAQVTRDE